MTVRDAETSDFRCFYSAADLVRHGLDPYDTTQWVAETRADPLHIPPCPATTFAYPLWTALFFVPVAFLPIQAAAAVWEGALIACLVGAVALLARTFPVVAGERLLLAIVLWSQPAFSAIANAQLGPIVLLGVAATAYGLGHARERLAGAAWLLLLLKPNMVLFDLALPIVVRRRTFAAVAIGGAVAVLIASLAVVPAWPVDLARVITGEQLLVDRDLSTLWSLAAALGLPSWIGLAASIGAVVAFGAAVPWRSLDRVGTVAGLTAASFLITPYTRAHDEVVLAVCWAATLAVASTRPALTWATAGVALILPWLLTGLSLVGLPLAWYALIPLAGATLFASAQRIR